MDISRFWLGSAAGGGDDPGDPIGQSLRFRGAQRLRGPDPRPAGDFTVSFWFKRADAVDQVDTMTFLSFAGNQSYQLRLDVLTCRRSTSNDQVSDGVIRDPSAWYHAVYVNDGGVTTLHLNGVEQANSHNTPNGSDDMTIGSNAEGFMDNPFHGYLADYHFIDGQTLEPTEFGRENNEGVWVPVAYDGDADDYGATGFHLDFSDRTNIGRDSSGNGNNFTNHGFNFDPVGIFSDDLFTADSTDTIPTTSTERNFFTNRGPELAFNGAAADTQCNGNESGGWLVWTPDNFTNVTSLQVWLSACQTIAINGTDTGRDRTSTTGGWVNLNGAFTSPLNLQSLSIRGNDANQAALAAVELNGTVLADNTGEDYDLMDDSPTQNYATLNPLNTTAGDNGIAAANLQNQDTNSGVASTWTGTTSMTGGLYYFEITRFEANNGFTHGILPDSFLITGGNAGLNESVRISQSGDLDVLSVNTNSYLPDINEGDTLCVAFNADNGRIWFGRNGTFVGDPAAGTNQAATVDMETGWVTYNRVIGAGGLERSASNWGQQPFLYTPPDGFNRLQTDNLPAATIANGRDHFGVVTYAGNNDQQREITGLRFTPDFVWIKQRDGESTHSLQDTVRGAGANSLRSDTNNLAGAGAAANGFIDRFDGNGFRLNRGTAPGQRVNANSSDYVAWCWRAGGAAVANNDGSIESQVSANTGAGFSIVSFDGTDADTIGHGLAERPELIFDKDLEDSSNWRVFHYMMDGGSVEWDVADNLHLNLTDGYPPDVGRGTRIDQVRDTFFRISGGTAGNARIAYCWHSVPGYSAFGSYQGNGDTNGDGPFVYLGFRPALLMIKATTRGGSWIMLDTTREPSNPANNFLFANSEAEEDDSTATQDLLSNGFKIRNNGTGLNQDDQTYLYCAWGENPFGCSNTSPANAR